MKPEDGVAQFERATAFTRVMFLSTVAFFSYQIVSFLLDTTAAAYHDPTVDTPSGYYLNSHDRNGEAFTSHPQIALWPAGKVPSERPDVFGDETVTCQNFAGDDCVDSRVYNVTTPTLTPYLVQSSDSAMVIAPGGGYALLAIDREGTNIAKWLNSLGISAFVLKYRVPERPWLPFGAAPLMDAQRAMGMVRSGLFRESLPYLNTSKVGFMGFSAGGHLTGHLNVQWAHRTYPPVSSHDDDDDEADKLSCRPDFSIMIYPWRSVSQPPVNEPISGASALNVTHETPPTMLVQTQDDPVHVENAIFYYLALKQAGVTPSELHVYPDGGHGYGDCTEAGIPSTFEVCTWPQPAAAFLRTLGVAEPLEDKSTTIRANLT